VSAEGSIVMFSGLAPGEYIISIKYDPAATCRALRSQDHPLPLARAPVEPRPRRTPTPQPPGIASSPLTTSQPWSSSAAPSSHPLSR